MLSPWQLSAEDQMPMGAGVFPLAGGFDPRSPSRGYGGHAVDAPPAPQPAGPGGASGYPYADEPQLPAYHTPQHQEYKPHGFWEGLENMVHGVNVSGSGPGALIAAAVALGLNSKLKSVSKRRTDTEEANAGIDASAKVNADREEKQYGERMKDWTERRVRAIEASKQNPGERTITVTGADGKPYPTPITSKVGQTYIATGKVAEPEEVPLELTGAPLDRAAMRYHIDGSFPPGGLSKTGQQMRVRIMRREAELYPGSGNIAGNRASYEADKTSLKSIQPMLDSAKAFEGTAIKNSKVMLQAMARIKDTGAPWLNRPLRSIDKNLLGSPEQAAYEIAIRTVIPEFAKLLSNPTLRGQLSDSARKEVEGAMSPNATIRQMYAAVKVLVTDAGNRTSEYQSAIDAINGRIQAAGDTGSEKAGAGAGKFRYDPATGTLVPK